MQQSADFIAADFLYMFRESNAHHQEYKIRTRQAPVLVVMVAGGSSLRHIMAEWGSTCNHNACCIKSVFYLTLKYVLLGTEISTYFSKYVIISTTSVERRMARINEWNELICICNKRTSGLFNRMNMNSQTVRLYYNLLNYFHTHF